MTPNQTELSALLAGLLFAIAVFAFKTAVGEFYWLSGIAARTRRYALLAATSGAYLLLWIAAGAVVTLARENPIGLFYRSKLFHGGAALHLLSAAGFFIWGALLLARRHDEGGDRRARCGWLLALPCPVCAGAIFLSAMLGKLLLPELGWKLWVMLGGCFFLVNFAVLGLLGAGLRRSGDGAERLTGYLMLFIGLYFAGLLFLVPNLEQVEAMYRVAAGTSAALPERAARLWILPGALVLAGFARQVFSRPSGRSESGKR